MKGVSTFVFLAVLATAVVPGNAFADQGGWIVQYGTAVRDGVGGVAVRGHDVYVAGSTDGTYPGQTSAGGADIYIRKYNSRGELQWAHQFGTPGADGVGAGNLSARGKRVVVGGFVRGALPDQTWAGLLDGFLRAYDREGNVLWTYQFGTPQNDVLRSIAIAKGGSIFVSGQTEGQLGEDPSAGMTDAFVMRLDRDGTVRWLRQFGTSSVDEAIGVAVAEEAVYVSGSTNGAFPGYENAGDFDGFVARLTLDGEIEWVTQFGTSAFDGVWKVGVTGSTIFVSGHTLGVFPGETSLGDFDGLVAAFAPGGQPKWVRQFGTAEREFMFGLAVDDEGAVVVGQAGGGGNLEASAQKYDIHGNAIWTIQFGTSVFDSLNAVALKGTDVYLAGATDGDLGGPNAGLRDAFLTRIRSVDDENNEDDDDDDEDDDDDD